MPYEYYFLKGLALTICCELAAGGIFITLVAKFGFFKSFLKLRKFKFIVGIMMASVMTLPYVWFVLTLIQPRDLFIVIAEIFAFVMEAFFYKYFFEIKFRDAFIFSFLLNLFSFSLGLVIFPLLS